MRLRRSAPFIGMRRRAVSQRIPSWRNSMIKVITVLRRKPGMNLAAFTEYWRTTHAEAVKRVPKIRRYVQSQTIASGYRTREPVYDGIAEIWYEDIGAMRGAAATLEAATAL